MRQPITEHCLAPWRHQHQFTQQNQSGERSTLYVLILTVVTMVAEIIAGTVYGSMALLADGWHMGTHAAAFLITLFAYAYARKHTDDPEFAFGTGKVSVLGGYTSAIALGLVALMMLVESTMRLVSPEQIQFSEAIWVALIGLTVNVVSVFLLKDHHDHSHGHSHGYSHNASHTHSHDHDMTHCEHNHEEEHSHDHPHEHPHDHPHHHERSHGHHKAHEEHADETPHHGHDHNLRAAYFHVLADALTSVLAIVALLFGKYMGIAWLDPFMGIVGAVIISRWAWGLIRQTSPLLLDGGISQQLQRKVAAVIESEPDHQIADLHIWRVSSDHYAVMVSIVSHEPKDADYFKDKLTPMVQLSHITVETNTCRRVGCVQADCLVEGVVN